MPILQRYIAKEPNMKIMTRDKSRAKRNKMRKSSSLQAYFAGNYCRPSPP